MIISGPKIEERRVIVTVYTVCSVILHIIFLEHESILCTRVELLTQFLYIILNRHKMSLL